MEIHVLEITPKSLLETTALETYSRQALDGTMIEITESADTTSVLPYCSRQDGN